MIRLITHLEFNLKTNQISREIIDCTQEDFANPIFVKALILDYLDDIFASILVQYAEEEDWTEVNFYDLLNEYIPQERHCHRWGIHIYRFDDFYVVANPDKDIVEVFRD